MAIDGFDEPVIWELGLITPNQNKQEDLCKIVAKEDEEVINYKSCEQNKTEIKMKIEGESQLNSRRK